MMIIGLDFDGTCVEHDFPNVGEELPHVVRVLKRLVEHGHQLMLFTMRSDGRPQEGDVLTHAVNWFKERDIPLWGINCNPDQHTWTQSPKQYAHIYIDDAGLGIPLGPMRENGRRPVEWLDVEKLLEELCCFGVPEYLAEDISP